jgi:hypothetical protein
MSKVTTEAVQLSLPDEPLPITRASEKLIPTSNIANADKQISKMPSLRCVVMLINVKCLRRKLDDHI